MLLLRSTTSMRNHNKNNNILLSLISLLLGWPGAHAQQQPQQLAAACTSSLPANAQFVFAGSATQPCTWYCNSGYFLPAGSSSCVACPLPLGGMFAGFIGPGIEGCLWTCPDGQQFDSHTLRCVACPPGTALFSGVSAGALLSDRCKPCTPPPSVALGCAAGTYLQMSPATCTPIGCAPCINSLTPGAHAYYYALHPTTHLSAYLTLPGFCFLLPCQDSIVPGLYLSGCGGTSPGNASTPCTVLPLWDGGVSALAAWRYYVLDADGFSRCATAPCAPCTQGGFYNALCPAAGGQRSTLAGACTTPCAPLPPNARWDFPWARPIRGRLDCPSLCNAGFYRDNNNNGASSSCLPCPDSTSCQMGYYLDDCVSRQCQPCPANRGPQSTSFAWIPSAPTIGSAACQWICVQGTYYYDLASASPTAGDCAPCVAPVCQAVGTYPLAACLTASNSRVAPSCERCVVPANAAPTGPGAAVNALYSCPFACNTGYFLSAADAVTPADVALGGVCRAWTPSSTPCPGGQYWGGGTPTADQRCVLCAGQPSSASYYVRWGTGPTVCAWDCASGGYFDPVAPNCLPCPPGTAKAGRDRATACPPCPDGAYANSAGSTACAAVPANAAGSPDHTDFVCNAGYSRNAGQTYQLGGDPACYSCAGTLTPAQILAALHLASARYDPPGACALVDLSCLLGYYRSYATANALALPGGACLPCPPSPGAVTALTATMNGTAAVWQARVWQTLAATCGLSGALCAYPRDELNLACPPAVAGCLPGYYLVSTMRPDPQALAPALACAACVNATCPPGQINYPCYNNNNSMYNPCTACPGAGLLTGQVWFPTGVCVRGCVQGYAYQGANAPCRICAAGTFQDSQPSQATACAACPAGTYAPTQALSACIACAPGATMAATNATACVLCAPGTYADAWGLLVCMPCPLGTYAYAAGASSSSSSSSTGGGGGCPQCSPELPYQPAPGVPCALPPAPACPPGFFQPNASSPVCIGCPAGTYCVGGVGMYAQACPAGSPPAPRLSSGLFQCAPPSGGAVIVLRVDGTLPVPCPGNTTTFGLNTATSAAWCYPAPSFAGFPGAAATLCPSETYCPIVALRPQICPAGSTFAPPGSILPSNCTAQMQPPCRPGYFLPFAPDDANTNGACAPCPSACYCPGAVGVDGTPIATSSNSSSSSGVVGACAPFASGAWLTPALAVAATQCVSKALSGPAACPALTHPPSAGPLTSALQCRANAATYFVPGLMAAARLCPTGYYCPPDTLQPIPCPPAAGVGVCTAPGTYPTPQPCPSGVSAPLAPCSACPPPCAPVPCTGNALGLPSSTAYYVQPGATCQFCCGPGRLKTLMASGPSVACQPPPTTFACAADAAYRAAPDPCGFVVPDCVACPPVGAAIALPLTAAQRTQLLTLTAPGAWPPGFTAALAAYGPGGCAYACPPGYCYAGGMNTRTLAGFPTRYLVLGENPQLLLLSQQGGNGTTTTMVEPCALAPPGYAPSPIDGTCAPCAAGTYLAEYGGTACRTCPSGATSAPGSADCVCPPANIERGVAAWDPVLGRNLTLFDCALCPIGTVWASPYTCTPCPPGTVCFPFQQQTAASRSSSGCSPGTYRLSSSTTAAGGAAATATIICTPCPPGSISSATDTSACSPCLQVPPHKQPQQNHDDADDANKRRDTGHVRRRRRLGLQHVPAGHIRRAGLAAGRRRLHALLGPRASVHERRRHAMPLSRRHGPRAHHAPVRGLHGLLRHRQFGAPRRGRRRAWVHDARHPLHRRRLRLRVGLSGSLPLCCCFAPPPPADHNNNNIICCARRAMGSPHARHAPPPTAASAPPAPFTRRPHARAPRAAYAPPSPPRSPRAATAPRPTPRAAIAPRSTTTTPGATPASPARHAAGPTPPPSPCACGARWPTSPPAPARPRWPSRPPTRMSAADASRTIYFIMMANIHADDDVHRGQSS